ncbi:hypothetical protein GmRootA79_44050 [Acidovorax sp. A79]|uniref:hypothetical protein n=1 Tax=Acidovorax sp. A79 TaxID=3056107 RepID=UPI0034E8C757
MSRGQGVRRFHRWASMAFTLAVVANFAAMALREGSPPPWVTYAPLPPLGLLLLTGLYLLAQPGLQRFGAWWSSSAGARPAPPPV